MQRFKKEKINGVLRGYFNPLAGRKEKYDRHPEQHRSPPFQKLHKTSIYSTLLAWNTIYNRCHDRYSICIGLDTLHMRRDPSMF